MKIPNPGTQDAIDMGCTCPVIDNHYGKGTPLDDDGGVAFWYVQECPIHGLEVNIREEDEDEDEDDEETAT